MSENKLDRTNLKRHAQRVESYSVLVSKRRAIYKNDSDSIHIGKSRIENRIERSQKLEHINIDIKEYEVNVQENQAFITNTTNLFCYSMTLVSKGRSTKLPHR